MNPKPIEDLRHPRLRGALTAVVESLESRSHQCHVLYHRRYPQCEAYPFPHPQCQCHHQSCLLYLLWPAGRPACLPACMRPLRSVSRSPHDPDESLSMQRESVGLQGDRGGGKPTVEPAGPNSGRLFSRHPAGGCARHSHGSVHPPRVCVGHWIAPLRSSCAALTLIRY